MNYSAIKSMAKEHGLTVKDLCALAPNNDPFYTGRKSEVAAAEWFAELWERFGGIYLRRIHYQAISQDPPVLRPNGEVYENSKRDWAYLGSASKWARYLGLIDPAAFDDRRNPEAIINASYEGDSTPGYYVEDEWDFGVDLPDFPGLPGFSVEGYTDGNLQPYHVEVWVEKTTTNDVLEPLCQRYGVNLVTGAGEQSITAVVDFMRRVRGAERPARILYVSDFDAAGLGMPISVARKIEFFQQRNGEQGLDIRLQPIVLTTEQVADYDLPRVPVKDTDKRKANWERGHGEGQVELDALEALHPGELERIMREAILNYYDQSIENEALLQESALDRALRRAHTEALAEIEPEIERLRDDLDGAVSQFKDALDRGRLQERLSKLHRDILARLDAVEVDTDGYPLPEPEEAQEVNGMLYVSERDYLTQLVAYKAYRHGSGGDGQA